VGLNDGLSLQKQVALRPKCVVNSEQSMSDCSSLLGITLAKGQVEPAILRTNGLRHVSPYWIDAHIPVRKLIQHSASTTTVLEALKILAGQDGRRMLPSAEWWCHELSASRVYLDADMKTIASANCSLDHLSSSASTTDCCLHARFHYHEQAAIDAVAEVIYSDNQYVIVSKPAGYDVLSNPAAGRARNSLLGLLMESAASNANATPSDDNKLLPKPAHRLDSPVSGLVCCGRNNSDVKRLSRRIELGETEKLYLARVKVPAGGLPKLPLVISERLGFDKSKSLAYVADGITGNGKEEGKEASTIVQECRGLMADDTAVVVIQILTGRKHQIRAHLQSAGIPIANDVRYGGNIEQSYTSAFGMPDPPNELKALYESNYVEGCRYCTHAKSILNGKGGKGPRIMDRIWLHCWKYSFPNLGMKFESPTPAWAA